MTIAEHAMFRYVFWAIGYSSGLLFFPLWVVFLLHMVPPKHKVINHLAMAVVGAAVILAVLNVTSDDVTLIMTRYGNQFSYYQSTIFTVAMILTTLVATPLIILQYIWWSGAERLRYRQLARMFIITAIISSSIGFVTDFIVPIFTTNTITPLGSISTFMASLTTYFIMFSNKTQRINVRNVSGFTFSSIMMPILVLDSKNCVGLENKSAEDFFGCSIMEKDLSPFIIHNGKPTEREFFSESFENEVITAETPIGVRTCEMRLTVEKDSLGDVIFKVVILRDRTESYYKDSLLDVVNQVSGILLEPDMGNYESNLYMAMGMLADAVHVDRVQVWGNRVVDNRLCCTLIYEWSESVESQMGNEDTKDVSYTDVFIGLEGLLMSGNCLNGVVANMNPAYKERMESHGIRSILVVPVFTQDRFWGFVSFDDCCKERVFIENEVSILRSASRLMVNAMIRNDMTEQLDTALTDELTGARSRRYFLEKAEEELNECIENGQNYSMIIIDADHFKKVNDTYGHPVGDEVLKILVARTRHTLKLDTLLGRYGGEEFLVSLPNISHDNVLRTAERIRSGIEGDTFRIDNYDNDVEVTISLGVASLSDKARHLSDIISNADKALYKAKQTGRNKVVFYEG